MARFAVDRRTNRLIPIEEAIAPVVMQPPLDPITERALAVLEEQANRRGGLPWGHMAFILSFGAIGGLADVTIIGYSRDAADLALVILGTVVLAEVATRLRSVWLEMVDSLGYHWAKAQRSRAWSYAWREQQATRRTIERRRMAEIAAREAEAAARAVVAHQTRVQQGNKEADRQHDNRRRLQTMLQQTYAEGPGKRWAGGQPFSQRAIGKPWFSELQRIGLVELAGRHPQWVWDEAGPTAEDAFEEILHRSPGFLSLRFEG